MAVAELREAIVRGDLEPGEPIRQEETARELGLSVIPVREALKTLANEGVVTYRPQRGYAVAELHADGVDGIFRVRELLEGEAERIAVRRIAPDGIAEMRKALEEQRLAAAERDVVKVIRTNRRFHFVLFERCDNPLLIRYVRQTWDSLDPHRAVAYRKALSEGAGTDSDRIHQEHVQVVEALESGDHDLAIRLLVGHRAGGQVVFHHLLHNGA
ncbi:GntR family transcriptional regulator [Streptomyces sp. NPDC056405]|uniref:GntR family transcriptional regulator n=1 Tax=Streptomyces sp. NPDC056405 TaxID=3345811 RepID=UPI0035D8AD14